MLLQHLILQHLIEILQLGSLIISSIILFLVCRVYGLSYKFGNTQQRAVYRYHQFNLVMIAHQVRIFTSLKNKLPGVEDECLDADIMKFLILCL